MLKRLYIHNYKCLVNFEINFDKDISLFLGANGSGKSTIFEVLRKLKKVLVNDEKVENIFEEKDIPRWIKDVEDGIISFEMNIEINNHNYDYLLTLSTDGFLFGESFYIEKESLYCNDELLFKRKSSIEDHKKNIRSGIIDYRFSTAFEFVNYLENFFISRINSYTIKASIQKSEKNIEPNFSNYAAWFAFLNENNRKEISILENNLTNILPNFDYFRIEQAGRSKILQVDFKNLLNKKEIISYDFDELSEGQKVLIALYTLIYCTPENSTICIDEPENFLALPEIQPWFDELYDQCAKRNLQVLLISHHPKIINFLASDSGYWFSRKDNHTQVEEIHEQNENGLSFSQLLELGWIYEG